MADKPIYYGSTKSSPIYYGTPSPSYGSSRPPMYYNVPKQYGQYGSYGAYGGVGGPGNDKSLVGTLTLGRILRVVSQRWLTIFVETPITYFNPVKTVNDLLNTTHQPR